MYFELWGRGGDEKRYSDRDYGCSDDDTSHLIVGLREFETGDGCKSTEQMND